ncbi:MAG: YceI family protein [Caldilineaceae bacterium]
MAWKIDSSHSQITFSARHMMISTVRGRFNEVDGTVEFDEQDPVKSSVNVKITADSIDTRDAQRDQHLKSADFLDAEHHPYLTFVSKRVEKIDDKHGRIIGDLTIRDTTREVVLDTEYAGQAKSPWGTTNAGFSAQTTLNRKEWGLAWNVALETGGVLVGEKINVDIELEIVKQ